MKKLPKMKYSDAIARQTQVRFGGYNHTKYARDGEIYDMKNITTEHYPLITPRGKRDICDTIHSGTIDTIGVSDKFYLVSDGKLYYDGVEKISVGEIKQVADTGNYMYFLPQTETDTPVCYNKKLDETITPEFYESLVLDDYNGERGISFRSNGQENYVWENEKRSGAFIYNYYNCKIVFFITLSTGEIKTFVKTVNRQSIDRIGYFREYYTYFNEYEPWGFTDDEVVSVSIASVPKLNYVCGTDNRIWGCDEKNIYCSAFGKPMEWYYYEASSSGNVSDNSWSIEPFDNGGEFTGCTVYRGTPIFFKENMVYEVYGDNPSNYRLQTYKVPGVAKGSHKSLQVIKDVLYYLSPEGVMRYSGGIVDNLTTQFNQRLEEGVGGNDGLRYYLSAKADGVYKLFVYDLNNRIWSIEDKTKALDFALYNRKMYMLDSEKKILCVNSGEHIEPITKIGEEDLPDAVIEFADCYMDTIDKKAISKIFARFGIEDGGELEILIDYDSNGNWNSIKKLSATNKKTYTLPIIPKRCDHFRIKLKGKKFVLHTLSYEYYNGSTL